MTLRILLRDFDTARAGRAGRAARKQPPRPARPIARRKIERGSVTPQYRNMADGLRERTAGRGLCRGSPASGWAARRELTIIRGGTDGSRLTELGLPTPNLSTGEHNPHSPLEWACLEEMVAGGRDAGDASTQSGQKAVAHAEGLSLVGQ